MFNKDIEKINELYYKNVLILESNNLYNQIIEILNMSNSFEDGLITTQGIRNILLAIEKEGKSNSYQEKEVDHIVDTFLKNIPNDNPIKKIQLENPNNLKGMLKACFKNTDKMISNFIGYRPPTSMPAHMVNRPSYYDSPPFPTKS